MSLNSTVERCVGRLSGEIKGIPAQPPEWKKYNMSTNQTAADNFFATATGKVQAGLFNLLSTYARSAHPVEQRIYNIWLGRDPSTNIPIEKPEGVAALDKEIAAAEELLAVLQAKKKQMMTSSLSADASLSSMASMSSEQQPTLV